MISGTGVFLKGSDEWETPQDLFDDLDEEFHFDLDPCATDENHKCLAYYTVEEDGLTKSWGVPGMVQSSVQPDRQMGGEGT